MTANISYHDMDPRLLINDVNDHNKWLCLVDKAEPVHHEKVAIYIEPRDYDRFTRAAAAFNAIMSELPVEEKAAQEKAAALADDDMQF
jgi:hypothetical protein